MSFCLGVVMHGWTWAKFSKIINHQSLEKIGWLSSLTVYRKTFMEATNGFCPIYCVLLGISRHAYGAPKIRNSQCLWKKSSECLDYLHTVRHK